ncbi:MAG: metallophosphoesterase [Candidatus Schekmanbacteria bacterium]|nr:metallophosphoesterase [Candidatus Schekmanbacteria bacterium]
MPVTNPYSFWSDDLVILHLSDLHAGSPDAWWCRPAGPYGREIRYEPATHEAIIEALMSLTPPVDRLDAIVVSGDFANRAEPQEFEAAEELLRGLRDAAERCFCTKPLLVLVPGNHDVSWAADRAAASANRSPSERDEAKLVAYRAFAERVGAQVDGARKNWARVPPRKENKRPVWIVGLSSCVREGHEPHQHYGYVGYNQLAEVFARRDPTVSPWDLQLAVFHHAISLNAPTLPLPPSGDPGALSAAENAIVRQYSNLLQGAEATLRFLGSHGIRAVLHGHQHYDAPIHASIVSEDPSNPWEVGGITMLGAGSAGLEAQSEGQIGPTAFQVLRFYSVFTDWQVITHRVVLKTQGRFSPLLEFAHDRTPRCAPLLSMRSHAHYRDLLMMALSQGAQKRPPIPEIDAFPLVRIDHWPRLCMDPSGLHRPVVAPSAAIAYWCAQSPYNAVKTYGVLHAKKAADARIELNLNQIRMVEALSTWLFSSAERKDAALRAQGLDGLFATINREDAGALRLGMNFAGLVRDQNGEIWLIVHRRSADVAWERGTIFLTFGGGVRESHLSTEEIHEQVPRAEPPFATATRRELFCETGMTIPGEVFPVALYLDIVSSSLNVVSTGWLRNEEVKRWDFEDDFAASLVRPDGGKSIRAARIELATAGRDRWESMSKGWFAVGGGQTTSAGGDPAVALNHLAKRILEAAVEDRWPWLVRMILKGACTPLV